MLTLEELERNHIEDVLIATNYNKKKASEILGVTEKTIRNKLKKHKIKTNLAYDSGFSSSKSYVDISKIDCPKYFATNKERLRHADAIINKNYL